MKYRILPTMASALTAFAAAVSAQDRLPACPQSSGVATWTNCAGETTRPDGSKYVGHFKDGKFHGHGTLTLPNGEVYAGEWLGGQRNGRATYSWPDGARYGGEFKDDRPAGQGTITYADGETYVGEFKDSKLRDRKSFLGADLRELGLAALNLQAQLDKKALEYQKRPRKNFIGANASEYRFAQYEEEWRKKIEQIGKRNYPEEARGRIYGSLRLEVTIRTDGSIDSTRFIRSSGIKVLDDAALRIVKLAAPFDAFPPDILRDTDLLVITRTWVFGRGDSIMMKREN